MRLHPCTSHGPEGMSGIHTRLGDVWAEIGPEMLMSQFWSQIDRVTASHGRVFVVRGFDLHVECRLVEIALAPRLLQPTHFVVVELAANELLKLLATDLLQGLLLLGGLEARLVGGRWC
jgi:hypothetical protein